MKFGDNLKKLRKLKKLSQEDLAEKVKVSRQSVSKWETGESYPEMNNILELCKIFHCHINDLVNDSIIDIDELDEEVKRQVVKLEKEQQKKVKGLSKAIYIISRIGRIITTISFPIIIILMITLGVLISKVTITNNEIKFNGLNGTQNKITITDDNNINFNDKMITNIDNKGAVLKIKEIFNNNSKWTIFISLETGLSFLVIYLILIRMVLKHLEDLFMNIHHGDTPFTIINVDHIKKMAYLLILAIVLPNVAGTIFEMIFKIDLNVGFENINVIEILFLFSMAYIFQYGYEIQLDSKGKMYGDDYE